MHNTKCHMCPRTRCVGALNDQHDPDLSKPRTSSSGHCLYLNGANGPIRIRVSTEAANSYYAQRSAEKREQTPPHLWTPPGYDEEELRKVVEEWGAHKANAVNHANVHVEE